MRTPNTKCVLCGKPLYRRPAQMAKVRYASCMACRNKAQVVMGLSEEQLHGLSLGRRKGQNGRTGYKHREESKRKCSESHKRWCAEHPDLVAARGTKTRAEQHYNWKGGISRLNLSIRQMEENRKWMEAIRERDGACQTCGSTQNLESHHIVSLASMIDEYDIKSRKDARIHAGALWAMNNGEALCRKCHYQVHGRRYAD